MSACSYKLVRIGDHFECTIVFPAGLSPVSVGTKGKNPRQAVSRAATAALAIVENPVLASILPPGTGAAVAALKTLASSPDVKAALSKFAGGGAKRLASVLGF